MAFYCRVMLHGVDTAQLVCLPNRKMLMSWQVLAVTDEVARNIGVSLCGQTSPPLLGRLLRVGGRSRWQVCALGKLLPVSGVLSCDQGKRSQRFRVSFPSRCGCVRVASFSLSRAPPPCPLLSLKTPCRSPADYLVCFVELVLGIVPKKSLLNPRPQVISPRCFWV